MAAVKDIGVRSSAAKSRNVLKKHVGLIHSSASLSLIERRLFNWLLFQSYDSLQTKRTHRLPLALLKTLMGWGDSNNNDGLRDALIKLTSTSAQFNLLNDDLGKQRWETASLLSWGAIAEGMVEWRYDESIAAWLHHPSIYGMLNLAIQQALTSSYSCALYEQVVRYKDIGKTKEIPIEVLRLLLDASADTVAEFRYFNRDVLKPAVAEINVSTDLQIEPVFIKHGKSIAAVRFLISKKAQSNLFLGDDDPQRWTEEEQGVANAMKSMGCSKDLIESALKLHSLDHLKACVSYVDFRLRDGKVKSSAAGYLAAIMSGPAPDAPVTSTTVAKTVAAEKLSTILADRKQAEEARAQSALHRSNLTQRIALLTDEQLAQARTSFESTLNGSAPTWNSIKRQYDGALGGRFQIWLRGYVVKQELVN
jgi:plasmid replication initiation protein